MCKKTCRPEILNSPASPTCARPNKTGTSTPSGISEKKVETKKIKVEQKKKEQKKVTDNVHIQRGKKKQHGQVWKVFW